MSTEQNIGENTSLDRRKLLKTAGAIAAGMALRSASPESSQAQQVENIIVPPNEPFTITELPRPVQLTAHEHFTFNKSLDDASGITKVALRDQGNAALVKIFMEHADPNRSLLNYAYDKIEADLEGNMLSDVGFSTDSAFDNNNYEVLHISADMKGIPDTILSEYVYRGIFAFVEGTLVRMDATYPAESITQDHQQYANTAIYMGKLFDSAQFPPLGK